MLLLLVQTKNVPRVVPSEAALIMGLVGCHTELAVSGERHPSIDMYHRSGWAVGATIAISSLYKTSEELNSVVSDGFFISIRGCVYSF